MTGIEFIGIHWNLNSLACLGWTSGDKQGHLAASSATQTQPSRAYAQLCLDFLTGRNRRQGSKSTRMGEGVSQIQKELISKLGRVE